ncbi:hypothetical protein TNCV_2385121 [Trichonephila clavipes]|nr:hypothetical protein TNCV_2385121 [Trichonephila clavipes]
MDASHPPVFREKVIDHVRETGRGQNPRLRGLEPFYVASVHERMAPQLIACHVDWVISSDESNGNGLNTIAPGREASYPGLPVAMQHPTTCSTECAVQEPPFSLDLSPVEGVWDVKGRLLHTAQFRRGRLPTGHLVQKFLEAYEVCSSDLNPIEKRLLLCKFWI